MASASTWTLLGFDTAGADLVLSRLVAWGPLGELPIQSISSAFVPIEGALTNLLVDDTSGCRFVAIDVFKPSFAITLQFAGVVELWGVRFAGPSLQSWVTRYALGAARNFATVGTLAFPGAGVLSAVPTGQPSFAVGSSVWNPVGGSRLWNGVAASDDGMVFLASTQEGSAASPAILSVDGGSTWSGVPLGNGYGGAPAVSGDGNTLLLGAGADINAAKPWISRDRGVSWVDLSAVLGTARWGSSAITQDGSKLFLVPRDSGVPRLSTDGGVTWTALTAVGNGNWQGAAMSSDGQVLALVNSSTSWLWMSVDGGVTWAAKTSLGARVWSFVRISGDGKTLLAGTRGAGFFTFSNDGGVTWIQPSISSLAQTWGAGDVSFDGGVLLACATSPARLFVSRDGGATWALQKAFGGSSEDVRVVQEGRLMLAAPIYLPLEIFVLPDSAYTSATPRPVRVSTQTGVIASPEAQDTSVRVSGVKRLDTEFGGPGVIYGTVELYTQAGNTPLPRRVRLHRSRDGLLVRETWSDAQGKYRVEGISERYTYDVIAWDHEGQHRSVVANDLRPEPMQ